MDADDTRIGIGLHRDKGRIFFAVEFENLLSAWRLGFEEAKVRVGNGMGQIMSREFMRGMHQC